MFARAIGCFLVAIFGVLATHNVTLAQFDQNYLVNGDFSQGIAGWHLWHERFNTRFDIAGGDLHIYGGDSGAAMNIGANGGIYQIVPVTPGVQYKVDGFWRSDPTAANTHWAEVLVLDGAMPENNVDVGPGGLLWKSDRFSGHGPWNGTISTNSNTTATTGIFTPTNNFVSLVLKAGNLDFIGVQGTRFDNLQLLGPAGAAPQQTAIYTGFESLPGETLGTMSTNGVISTANPQVDNNSLMFDNTTNTATNFHWTSDVVDVSGMTDVSVNFAWTAPGGAFETSDSLSFAVLIDNVLTPILTLNGNQLDANAPNVNNDGFWYENVSFDIPASAQLIQLQFSAATTGNDEDIFIDDVYITGTPVAAAVPEPASFGVWVVIGVAAVLCVWRRRP
jgi:hypothetical protein